MADRRPSPRIAGLFFALCAGTFVVGCGSSDASVGDDDTGTPGDTGALADLGADLGTDSARPDTAAADTLDGGADTTAAPDSRADAAPDSALDSTTIDASDAFDSGPDVVDDTAPEAAVDTGPIDAGPPVAAVSGLPMPLAGVYDDKGVAAPDALFRALIGFPIRDEATLDALLVSLYTPTDASFRAYLDGATWNGRFAPLASDVDFVKAWLESNGMAVPHVASNRLLLEFTGTVAQFNAAFGTTLHVLSRKNPSVLTGPIDVYGVTGPLTAPTDVASKIDAIVSADLPADTTPLKPEVGTIDTAGPSGVGAGFVPAQLATAYGLDPLYAAGSKGDGARLGVVVGAAYKHLDLQSFWQSFGITRADPTVVSLMEPPATRFLESTIDVEWSGSLAPMAPMTVYQGPDSRDTALVYVFDEAIARDEVDVLTISFAHREDSEQPAVRRQYEAAAKEAAALGITVLAAAGDGGQPDVPAVCPHVTAVGGTNLSIGGGGAITETGTTITGAGPSATFPLPDWQASTVTDSGGQRAVVDVALNAQGAYWVYYLGTWSRYLGTSFSSPVFAGVMSVVDGARTKASKATAGFLNPALYGSAIVQATFRDVVAGGATGFPCKVGWDYSTGWGAPNGGKLADALP